MALENGNRILMGVKQEKQHTPRAMCSTLSMTNESTIYMGVHQLFLLNWEAVFNSVCQGHKTGFFMYTKRGVLHS